MSVPNNRYVCFILFLLTYYETVGSSFMLLFLFSPIVCSLFNLSWPSYNNPKSTNCIGQFLPETSDVYFYKLIKIERIFPCRFYGLIQGITEQN